MTSNRIIGLFFSLLLFALVFPAIGQQTVSKQIVSGVVKDAITRKPMGGIRLSVEGFSAAITNEKGEFNLTVSSYLDNVMITADDYSTKQISLKGRKQIEVLLQPASLETFQDMVTLPFGEVSKRNNVTSTSTYNPNSEWKRPNETVDALLQGQIAGLNSIRRSGVPGVGANIFLRGINSLYGTNKPMVIIDGMPFDINDYGQSIIASNYTNPLALLNAQDIENVTVLKDASSIYGTKGINGAILITTSRAKRQSTDIDFGAYTGINIQPSVLPVMDASNYRSYLTEILQSRGLTTTQIAAMPFINDDTTNNLGYFRYHNNTNWQKNIFKNSFSNNYFLKVTGGDNVATYALSVGYGKNNGIVENTDLSRYSTRFNAAFNFSKKFTGSTNLSFTFNEQKLKDQGIANKTAPLYMSLIKAPFLTANEVNAKGVFSPNLEEVDVLGIGNPKALINNMQASSKYYRFAGSFLFGYEINRQLSASAQIGVLFDKTRENIFVPRKGVANDTISNAIIDSRLGTQVKRLFSLFADAKIEYKKSFGTRSWFRSALGTRYQHNQAEQDYTLGFNSATDELISVQNGLNELRQVGGGIGEWNWMNTYFNAAYAYRDKLFFYLNASMDASSRFGAKVNNGLSVGGVPFAISPSVGISWLASSENFMASSKIDLLKFRATYSLAGNDDIGNYTAKQTYGSQNLLGMQGLVRNGIANPYLQWETAQKINVGMDLAFLNERVNLSVDLFKNNTNNMLVYEVLPAASGFNTIVTNNGSMQNTGIDASLNIRVINQSNFKWDVGSNIATYKNEVLEVPDGNFFTEYAGATILTKKGSAANQFYGYVAEGVFSTAAQAAAAGLTKKNTDGSISNFGAGDVQFKDLNNDKIIDEKDRQVIGSPNPEFIGGITNKFTYKRFQLDALFTFSKGNEVFNYLRYRLESASGIENQLQSVVNRWRTNGQQTVFPKATWGDPMGNSRFSNRWIEDGSYLRLRSVSLYYMLKVKEGFIKNATIYLTGNNLLTFTKYMGYDPEFSANTSVFAQGIDTGLDPLFKSVTVGVKIGL